MGCAWISQSLEETQQPIANLAIYLFYIPIFTLHGRAERN